MEAEVSSKRTPIYESHKRLGGKLVGFAGWELPLQYSGIIAEHQAVRGKAGLFDVSHMGEITVSGAQAEQALEYLTCNKVSAMLDGKGQYNAILNPDGGVVDDIIVYRRSRHEYFVCVNAANTDKDFAWFKRHNRFDADFENKSSRYGQVALQGPRAQIIWEKISGKSAADLRPFHFAECEIKGSRLLVARTGYTGEDGFEIFIPWGETLDWWEMILDAGRSEGLIPAGLGARDSLRLEACYPLHGHELADDVLALESGLSWIVKFDKGDFIGKQALLSAKAQGCRRALIGFFVDEPGIARHGDKLYLQDAESGPDREIGWVTSGTKTPTVNRALGLALVDHEYAKVGAVFSVDVRGRRLRCHAVEKPFYRRGCAWAAVKL